MDNSKTPSVGDILRLILSDAQTRSMIQRDQMGHAQAIENDFRPRYPELPVEYQPPEFWNYGQPVRMG